MDTETLKQLHDALTAIWQWYRTAEQWKDRLTPEWWIRTIEKDTELLAPFEGTPAEAFAKDLLVPFWNQLEREYKEAHG